MIREGAYQGIFVWPAVDPHAVPAWVWWLANYLANLPIVLMVVGAALMYVPLFRPIWVIETGQWLLASGVLLVTFLLSLAMLLVFWPLGITLVVALVIYVAWWVLPSHRQLVVITEGVIDGPPDRLFPLAIEPASQMRLQPALQEAFIKGGGPLGVGSVIVARARVKGLRINGEDMLLEYDPPHRYTERTLNAPPNQVTVTFESLGEQTLVTCRYVGQLSPPNAILSGLLKGRTARDLRKHREEWLAALRREAARP